MHARTAPNQSHRIARLAAWVAAAIAWLACAMVQGATARRAARRGFLTADRLECMVSNLVILHASDILAHRRVDRRSRKRYGPHRLRACSNRAIAGSWMRRTLKRRGSALERLARLAEVMRNLGAFAAEFARHRRRGLSKLLRRTRTPEPGYPRREFVAVGAPGALDSS
jgi:hypothetical protein